MKSVTLEELLEAGAHFGHQARRWNPRVKPYLYGLQGGVHLFDLVQTKDCLDKACEFVSRLAAEGKKMVFVGTKRQAVDIVREEAKRVKAPYVSQRWLGGMITNWDQIRKSIKLLIQMREDKASGKFEKYTKKEQVLLDRKIVKLERFLNGLVELEKIPEALFVVDVKTDFSAVKEARMKQVPVVAIVDSNVDPNLIDYVIPANDDAIKSIKLLVTKIADAYDEGRQSFEKRQAALAEKNTASAKKTEATGSQYQGTKEPR